MLLRSSIGWHEVHASLTLLGDEAHSRRLLLLLGLRLQNGWLEGLLLLNRLLRLVGGHMHSRVEDRQRLVMLQLSLLLDSSDFELLLPQLILLVHQLELLVG